MRLIKLLVVLIVAAVIALVGYAYLGDMQPNQREVRDPIPIQDGALAPVEAGTESAPAEDAPAADAPAADAPAEDAPAEETPAEDAPAGDQPAPITDEDTTEAPGD